MARDGDELNMATDEEVAERKAAVARLREEVANGERARREREREDSNDITLANLMAEEARLKAQIASQRATEAQVGEEGGVGPVAQTLDAMKLAVQQQKAQEALADNPTGESEKAPTKSSEAPSTEASTPPTPPAEPAPKTAGKVK